jgi:hypothetical protein
MKKRNEAAKKIPDDIIVWAVRAVSGGITPSMRMIAFAYDQYGATFRFYMCRDPSKDEREIAEVIAVNFESGLSNKLGRLDIEFIVTNEPLGALDVLGFGLYRRWEEV